MLTPIDPVELREQPVHEINSCVQKFGGNVSVLKLWTLTCIIDPVEFLEKFCTPNIFSAQKFGRDNSRLRFSILNPIDLIELMEQPVHDIYPYGQKFGGDVSML